MKLYEECSECLGSDPKVTPAITLESAENEEVVTVIKSQLTPQVSKGISFFSIRDDCIHEGVHGQT